VLLLSAFATRSPIAGTAAAGVLVLLLRTLALGDRALRRRRHATGPRRGDVALAAMSGPWHLLRAAAALVLTLPLAVVLGGAVAGVLILTGVTVPRAPAVPLVTVALTAFLTVTCLPGTRGVRRGAAVAARVVTARGARSLLAAACLAAAAVLVLTAGPHPSSWPAARWSTPLQNVIDRLDPPAVTGGTHG